MEYVDLEKCCEILDSQRIPITECDRKKGIYPYYGANGIQDYVDNYIFDDELVLIAEDGGNFGSKTKPIAYRVSGKCWVNNHAHVIKANSNYNIDYLCYALKFYDTTGIVNGATRQKLTQASLRKMRIPYLPLQKQQEIVSILDKINAIIDAEKKQLELLDETVKSRFIEMFKKSEKEKLCNLITSYKAKRCGNNNYEVLSITMHDGLVYQKDRFKKEIASKDKSNYKIVPYNTLVVAFPIDEGLLSVQDLCDNGIVSPAYNLYTIDTNKIIPQLLEQILRSEESINYYKSNLRGVTLRRRTIPKEAFDNMPIVLPQMNEQEEYMSFIERIDKSKFVDYSKYFLWAILTFTSSTMAYSNVVSILECPNKCCTCSIGIPLSIALVAKVLLNLWG